MLAADEAVEEERNGDSNGNYVAGAGPRLSENMEAALIVEHKHETQRDDQPVDDDCPPRPLALLHRMFRPTSCKCLPMSERDK